MRAGDVCTWDEFVGGRVIKCHRSRSTNRESSCRYHVNCRCHLRRSKQSLSVGDKVFLLLREDWRPGTISLAHLDGTFDVAISSFLYDVRRVDRSRLRPRLTWHADDDRRRAVVPVDPRKGLDPVRPFDGELRDLERDVGWMATRAPTSILRQALKDDVLFDDDDHGWTLLHHAAAGGCVDHLRIILAHSSEDSINQPEALQSFTPLHLAVAAKFPDIVKLLMQHGADPEKPDKHGESPRDIAAPARHGPRAKAVRLHLLAGGKKDDEDSKSG